VTEIFEHGNQNSVSLNGQKIK